MLDVEQLRAVLGSRDATLEAEIIGGCFTTVRYYFVGWAGGRIGHGGPTLTDAVSALLNGGPFDHRYAYQYGYALEPICAAVGEELDNSLWCEVGPEVYEEVDDFFHRASALLCVEQLCLGRPLPFDIPCAPNEPHIGFRGRAEIADIAVTLDKACAGANASDEWIADNARAVRDWYAHAADAGLDLVFFAA